MLWEVTITEIHDFNSLFRIFFRLIYLTMKCMDQWMLPDNSENNPIQFGKCSIA